ncbi:MAG: hypothetical protein P4L46_15360 [Fimbriimonas sp.]|nr:hypothetical protein [Fimbriimonas sp.]
MDWSAWSGLRNEPELRSLYEWLDTQTNYAGSKIGAIVGTVAGISFGIAMFLGVVLLKASHLPLRESPAYMIVPMVGAIAVTMGTWAYMYARATAGQKEHWRRLGGSRSFVWKLWSARWSGNLAGTIGKESALALNAAAYDYLRCRDALQSPAWRGLSSDSAWASARGKAEMAIEAAMARLLTMMGQGGSPEYPEVQKLLEDMHQTADEIVRTAEKLAVRKGVAGDVSHELRQVLSEMRVLNAAHDEVMEIELGDKP